MGKVVLALLLVVVHCHVSQASAMSWADMLACVLDKLGWWSVFDGNVLCAAGKLFDNYNAMMDARCRNCDKYFHCQANYEAVYGCGNHPAARNAAEKLR